jgi:1-acyl-sn-glycerol-3-phosphate acyltransferase
MNVVNPYVNLPLTFIRCAVMTYSTLIYVGQLLYGSVLGFFWFTIGRKTDEKRRRFHEAIYRFFCYNATHHPLFRVDVDNSVGEKFERGAIVVCNHQSMLDTLCMLMLSPRILLVTHNRVWNNPLVAAVLRYADFFSVSDTEWGERTDYCRHFLNQGYSIVIFPEGERSADGDVHRFHRGAFFLAERLHADILPIFIHGAAHVMPIGRGVANAGTMSIEIGRRIAPDDVSFGEGYVERCRGMHRYYQNHYAEIRRAKETPEYFRSLVTELYAAIGLGREAWAAQMGLESDRWDVKTFVDALVYPDREFRLEQSSPLKKLYNKYNHLPKNIQFV